MLKYKCVLIINLFLILVTLTAFWQVGNHGFVDYDDNQYITENSPIQSGLTARGIHWAFTTGHAANWHPLTWISHMLDIQLFGLKPQRHHLTNLLFHIANVLLLFFALRRMTKALWQSAFVAALFALHPLHVESVAWVAERKDVLSTFFFMLTLIAYHYYTTRRDLKSYLAVIICFALGLMAKPMLVTLPFLLLLLDYWPIARFRESQSVQPTPKEENSPVSMRKKKGKAGKRTPKIIVEMETPGSNTLQWASIRPLILEKIPLFGFTILSCTATYIVQKTGTAVGSLEFYTPVMRISNAFVSYLIYITKMVWPDDLAVFYPYPGLPPLPQVLGAALLLIVVTFAVFRAARRFPYLPVGWLWFTGTLIPVIGIVQVGSQAMADRYTYVPSIGLFIIAAWGIPEVFRKRRHGKAVLAVSAALCLLCLLVLTRTQVGYWQDSITLFDHALNVTKDNYYIRNVLGDARYRIGDHRQAIEDYGKAIEINPRNIDSYNNRGKAYNLLGDNIRAIEDYDRVININPRYAEAYFNRGNAFSSMLTYNSAIKDFDMAIEINPRYAQAYNNRGTCYMALGNSAQAMKDYHKAIDIDPNYSDAYCNLGIYYKISGDYQRAIDYFNKSVLINPEHIKTYFNRGIAYAELDDHMRAVNDFSKTIELNSKYSNAYFNRGLSYTGLGDHMKAINDFSKAIDINPKHAKACFNLGLARSALGDLAQAIGDYDRAIAIDPEYPDAYFYRGMTYDKLGKKSEATEDLKKAARFGSEAAQNALRGQGINW